MSDMKMNSAGATGKSARPIVTIEVSGYISVNGEFVEHRANGRAAVRSNGKIHEGKLVSKMPIPA
jgi:hypothetical protein